MTKTLLGGLAAIMLAASLSPAAAQTVQFTVINNSSLDLHYFYASPSNENSWGEDLLGTGVLEAGYQATATIGDGSDQCLYDFKFLMENSAELIEPGIDICQLDSYTITD